MAVAAVAALVFETLRIRSRNRFPLSAVSIGLGVILPPEYCFTMWVGAMGFWWLGRKHATPGTPGHARWVEGCEPVCAGLISGSALIGIGNAIVTDRAAVHAVAAWLKTHGWTVVTAEIGWLPKQCPELDETARGEVGEFLQALEDHDDVQRVWAAVK